MNSRRALLVATAVATLSFSVACDKKADTGSTSVGVDPAASGGSHAPGALTGAAATTSVSAQAGGQVIALGAHDVEIRLFKNGQAEAYVYDAKGAAISDLAQAKLTLRANATGDAHPTIELGFAAPLGRLSGEAAGGVDLVPGPVGVELALNGATAKGELAAPVLLVGPEMGGTLAVAGKYGVELLAHVDGSVEALVRDAAGVRVGADAGLKLEAKLQGIDGQAHAVALVFDAKLARFVGRVDAAVKLAAGQAEISVNGEAGARLPKLALSVEASHGGRVVTAGDFSVEVVAKGNAVSAFAFDASGAAAVKGDLDLALRLGTGAFVKLVWDAPSASYRAKLDAAVDLALQPITVSVKADGKAFIGASLPSLAVDAKAKLAGDAKAGLGGKASLDAKANVKAPTVAATAKVEAPKIKVTTGTSGGAGTGGAASAKAGFSFGTK